MVLAKNRIPILAVGIVLFLGLLFTFYGLQRVNAQTPPTSHSGLQINAQTTPRHQLGPGV